MARRLGVVDVFASGAVELDGLQIGHIREAHGKEGVGVTHDTRAFSKLGLLVLV